MSYGKNDGFGINPNRDAIVTGPKGKINIDIKPSRMSDEKINALAKIGYGDAVIYVNNKMPEGSIPDNDTSIMDLRRIAYLEMIVKNGGDPFAQIIPNKPRVNGDGYTIIDKNTLVNYAK